MQLMIHIELKDRLFEIAWYWSHRTGIAGKSICRPKGRVQRKEEHFRDQLVGCLGNLALSLYVTGGPDEFIRSRVKAALDPWAGDGGTDILGMRVDMKASLEDKGNWRNYHLIIHPQDLHEDTNYYFGVVHDPCRRSTTFEKSRRAYVTLLGTIHTDFISEGFRSARFGDQYAIPQRCLKQCDPDRLIGRIVGEKEIYQDVFAASFDPVSLSAHEEEAKDGNRQRETHRRPVSVLRAK